MKVCYEAFLEGNNNPNNLWKLFKNVGARKHSNSKSNLKLTVDNILLEDAEDVLNAFNIFFVQVAENMKKKINSSFRP